VRKFARPFWLLMLIVVIAACSPATPATEESAEVTEAAVQPTATAIVRQPEGETLVYSAGIVVFTVPNEDGRWVLQDMQGDRLVPAEGDQNYNVRLSAIRDVESFEDRVTTLTGDDDVTVTESEGDTYATVQRPDGTEYFVDRGDVILVARLTIIEGQTVTAPERNAILEAVLATTVDFIE